MLRYFSFCVTDMHATRRAFLLPVPITAISALCANRDMEPLPWLSLFAVGARLHTTPGICRLISCLLAYTLLPPDHCSLLRCCVAAAAFLKPSFPEPATFGIGTPPRPGHDQPRRAPRSTPRRRVQARVWQPRSPTTPSQQLHFDFEHLVVGPQPTMMEQDAGVPLEELRRRIASNSSSLRYAQHSWRTPCSRY